jgi:hypothetical protein
MPLLPRLQDPSGAHGGDIREFVDVALDATYGTKEEGLSSGELAKVGLLPASGST